MLVTSLAQLILHAFMAGGGRGGGSGRGGFGGGGFGGGGGGFVGRSIRLMVTTTDTTDIVTQPKLEEHAQPSLKRWLKHFLYACNQAVFLQAGPACDCISCRRSRAWACGEIQVVIEGCLPSRSAYYQDTLCRARQLLLNWVYGIQSIIVACFYI